MGDYEVPYCKLYDLGYTYLGDKLDSLPNPFSLISQDKGSLLSNSEDPLSSIYEVDALGEPDSIKFLRKNFKSTLSQLQTQATDTNPHIYQKKYKPAFLSSDNYEPFSRISNYNGLPLSGNYKFLLKAENIRGLVVRTETDVEPLKILEERIDMVEIALEFLSRQVVNIELNVDLENIRDNLE